MDRTYGLRLLEEGRAIGLPEYRLDIDGPAFRRQRELLDALTGRAGGDDGIDEQEQEDLAGLQALLDAIADQAHDAHGIDCLLSEEV